MKDHRLRLLPEPEPKSKNFVICRECMNKELAKGISFTIWWWAKSKCSYCKRTGASIYPKGLVVVAWMLEDRLDTAEVGPLLILANNANQPIDLTGPIGNYR